MGPELAPGDRIDTGGRLIEEEHFRLVQDGTGERQALLEAERQVLRRHVVDGAEIEDLSHELDSLALSGAGKAVDAREEIQVLQDAQIAVEGEFLRHVAEPVARLGGVAPQIEAGDASFAGGRLQKPAQHLESGRLAGAVRPEQAENLTARDVEGDVVGSGEIAEALCESACFDHRPAPIGGERPLCFGKPRPPARTAAEHIDEGVFEARRRRRGAAGR